MNKLINPIKSASNAIVNKGFIKPMVVLWECGVNHAGRYRIRQVGTHGRGACGKFSNINPSPENGALGTLMAAHICACFDAGQETIRSLKQGL